jgi:peptide deformylase
MKLVELEDLPKLEDIQDVPLDDPMKVYKLCQEMEAICERENGIGLSAVQVGIPWKLFIVKSDGSCPFIEKGKYGYFANTNYKATDEELIVSLEGCLSIRSLDGQLRFFQVPRHKYVQLCGQRLYIDDKDLNFIKIDCLISIAELGVVFQHEIDHHSAVLISNVGKEIAVW